MERGVVSLLRLQRPHTGPYRRDSGAMWLCRQLIFRVSSFPSPFQKVFFFVYAAQFLYRRLHPSIPLIMFYRTLLGGSKDGASCTKTALHKQRKRLFGMDSEKMKPGRSTAGKATSLRCRACMGLCAAFAAGVRKQPLAPYQLPLGRFCGTFGKAGFFSSRCGSARQVRPRSHSQISRI